MKIEHVTILDPSKMMDKTSVSEKKKGLVQQDKSKSTVTTLRSTPMDTAEAKLPEHQDDRQVSNSGACAQGKYRFILIGKSHY